MIQSRELPKASNGAPYSSAVYFFLFLGVFVTLGLFPADISPFYLLFVILLGVGQIFFAPVFTVSRDSIVILVIAVSIVVIDVLTMRNIEIVKLLASFGLMVAFLNMRLPSMTYRIALIVAILWLTVTVVSLAFPKLFSFLFFRVGATASRGATGLGPEPAYWGFASALLVLYFDRYRFSGKEKGSSATVQILFGLSALVSLSFLAYIYFFLVLWHIFGAKRTLLVFAGVLVTVVFLLPSNLRIVSIVEKIFSSGLVEVLMRDSSSSQRLNGFGLIPDVLTGNFPVLGTLGSDLTGSRFNYDVDFNVIAGFQLVYRYGIVGLFFCLAIFVLYVRPFLMARSGRSIVPIAILVTVIVFVGPIAFPYFLFTVNKLSAKEHT